MQQQQVGGDKRSVRANKRANAVHHTRRRQRRRRRKLKTKRRQWRAGFYLWRHQLSRHHRESEERTQQEDIAEHLCSAQCSTLCTIILFRHFFPSFLSSLSLCLFLVCEFIAKLRCQQRRMPRTAVNSKKIAIYESEFA